MADLAIGISKTAVEALVKKVKTAIKEEAELWQIVQRDTVFMKDEFEMMQSFLKTADWEQVKTTMGRTWVRQVRELSYDAEDSIESILLLDTKRSFWTLWRRLLASCNCDSGAPLPLEQAVAEIKLLKARVEEVSRRNKRYNLINNSCSIPVVPPQQQASVHAIGTTGAFGILTEAWSTERKLGGPINLPTLVNDSNKSLRVISLWGTRGDLGVTSIIKEVYEGEEIRQKFRNRAWLKLAHPFNPHKFIERLAEQFYRNYYKDGVIIAEFVKGTNLRKLFELIMNNGKYLVVLEGLSNMSEWQAALACLPDSNDGSRIVVSTQQLEVARWCVGQSYQVSELKKLPDNHSICTFFNQGFKRVEMGNVYNGPSLQEWAKGVKLVGRSSDEKELSDLISSASRVGRPQVISVWGFPGIGKSALVKVALSGNEFKNQASLFRCYIDVSYQFDLTVFYRRILSCASKDAQKERALILVSGEGKTEQIKTDCIEFLKNHPTIIVIDGLRTTKDWDSIKEFVSEPSLTSSIIVVIITAEETVANYCTVQDDSVYRVKALEPDDAVALFEKNFQGLCTIMGDAQVKKETNYIVNKCGGIPKVIIALARYLGVQQGDTLQRKLSHLKANFIQELETNPEFIRLRDLFAWMHTKFYDLPWCLKRCILYQSVFSEANKEIQVRRSRFVRRWIAEGYSKCTNSKTMEEYAAGLFNSLTKVTASMGQWQFNSFFHEYINSRLMEQRAIFFPLVVSIFDKSRCLTTTEGMGQHLVIGSSWNRDQEFVFEDADLSHLQSLTVHGEWKPFFILSKMASLRVLDLEGTLVIGDDELQRMLELLPRLRFLSLKGHKEIKRLPDSFSGLRHLQTLDIRSTSIVYIDLHKLPKLQCVRAGTSLQWMGENGVPAIEESTPLSNSSSGTVSRLFKFLGYRPAATSICSGTVVSCSFKFLVGRPAGTCNGVKVSTGIRHLKALSTLGVVNVSTANGKHTLTEMGHLKQLKKLEVSGINSKNSKYLSKAIVNQKNLESLSMQLQKEKHCVPWDAISFPSSIQSLELCGHVKKLSALNFESLRSLRKLSIEMTELLTQEDMEHLGTIQSLITLRLRVDRSKDMLEFTRSQSANKDQANGKNRDPARPPVNKHQADGKQQVPDRLPVSEDQGGKQQVHVRLFCKLQVLEVVCMSKLHLRFDQGAMEKLEMLKAYCCNDPSLMVTGLEHPVSLKQVCLQGSYGQALEETLQEQLGRHLKKPALKLQPKPGLTSSQARQRLLLEYMG